MEPAREETLSLSHLPRERFFEYLFTLPFTSLFCFFDKTTTSAPSAARLSLFLEREREKLAFSGIFRRSRQLTSRFTTLPISLRVLSRPVTRECSEMASSSRGNISRRSKRELTRGSDFSRGRSSRPRRHKILYI